MNVIITEDVVLVPFDRVLLKRGDVIPELDKNLIEALFVNMGWIKKIKFVEFSPMLMEYHYSDDGSGVFCGAFMNKNEIMHFAARQLAERRGSILPRKILQLSLEQYRDIVKDSKFYLIPNAPRKA